MCILPMWQMGRVHQTICQMSQMQKNEILQQGMPKECLGLSQTLVCGCNSIALIVVIACSQIFFLQIDLLLALRSRHYIGAQRRTENDFHNIIMTTNDHPMSQAACIHCTKRMIASPLQNIIRNGNRHCIQGRFPIQLVLHRFFEYLCCNIFPLSFYIMEVTRRRVADSGLAY